MSSEAISVRVPGRVNLIGEWIDFSGGTVLPMPIRSEITLKRTANGSPVDVIRSAQFGSEARFDIHAPAMRDWSDAIRGALQAARAEGWISGGQDVTVSSDIPVGQGLSSSAATIVATLKASRPSCDTDDVALAQMARAVENNFMGVPCGIMDQIVVAGARAGHAMLIDCDVPEGFAPVPPEKVEHVPMPPRRAAKVVVIDTRVRHRLADGAYAERVAIAKSAAAKLGVRHLCHAPTWTVFALTQLEKFATRHSVTEFERVHQAVAAMRRGDIRTLGRLMAQSGSSLRFDERVSCDELDTVVEFALRGPGCYGVRLTGAGFGGCAVALGWPAGVGRLCERVTREFTARHGHAPEIRVTGAAPGAELV